MPGTKNATYDFPAPGRILRGVGDASAHFAVDGRFCACGTVPGGQDAAALRAGGVGHGAGGVHYAYLGALSTVGNDVDLGGLGARRRLGAKDVIRGRPMALRPWGALYWMRRGQQARCKATALTPSRFVNVRLGLGWRYPSLPGIN